MQPVPSHSAFAAALDAAWCELKDHIAAARANHARFAHSLAGRLTPALAAALGPPAAPYDEILERAEKEFVDAIIEHAEACFGDAHAPLVIERRLLGQRTRSGDFAPLALWHDLVANYGEGKGAAAAHAQAANAIATKLKLRRTIPKTIGDRLSLEGYLSSEPAWDGGGRQLAYQTVESMNAMLRGLGAFLAQLDGDRYAHEIRAVGDAANAVRRWRFTSRDRIPLGRGLMLVLYQEKFELRVTRELAAELNLYLTTYAAPHLLGAA
jgi:hypothetical protein